MAGRRTMRRGGLSTAVPPAGMARASEPGHKKGMKTVLTVLLGLAMLGTLGVLLAGMIGLVRGGDDPWRSNRLMRWRVILQGIALALFALLVTLMRS